MERGGICQFLAVPNPLLPNVTGARGSSGVPRLYHHPFLLTNFPELQAVGDWEDSSRKDHSFLRSLPLSWQQGLRCELEFHPLWLVLGWSCRQTPGTSPCPAARAPSRLALSLAAAGPSTRSSRDPGFLPLLVTLHLPTAPFSLPVGPAQSHPVPLPGTKTLSGSVATMDTCVRHFQEATGKRALSTSCGSLCLTREEVSLLPAVSALPGNVPSCPRHDEKGWDQRHWPRMSNFLRGGFILTHSTNER